MRARGIFVVQWSVHPEFTWPSEKSRLVSGMRGNARKRKGTCGVVHGSMHWFGVTRCLLSAWACV